MCREEPWRVELMDDQQTRVGYKSDGINYCASACSASSTRRGEVIWLLKSASKEWNSNIYSRRRKIERPLYFDFRSRSTQLLSGPSLHCATGAHGETGRKENWTYAYYESATRNSCSYPILLSVLVARFELEYTAQAQRLFRNNKPIIKLG
jgi:hypothetical protein